MEGQEAVGEMQKAVGFGFKPSKRKPAAHANKFKGVVTDFSPLAERGEVLVYVEDIRKT